MLQMDKANLSCLLLSQKPRQVGFATEQFVMSHSESESCSIQRVFSYTAMAMKIEYD